MDNTLARPVRPPVPAGNATDQPGTAERWVGARIPRVEDRNFLIGGGRYVDDITPSDVLHAVFVRSSHAHARLRHIDCERARALPGVAAVCTLQDLAPQLARTRMTAMVRAARRPAWITPFILASEEVCFVGETIAIVIASSRRIAEDAAALVDIDYEPLPVVANCRQSVAPDAPRVRLEAPANTLPVQQVGYGDVATAFAGAAHVFSESLSIQRGSGHSMEPRGLVAEWNAREGSLLVHASTQKPHDLLQSIADCLGLEESSIRVVVPDVGGGFGPKLIIYPEDMAVCAVARKLGRSIKWVEDRRENFVSAVHERDQLWEMEVAVEADGRLRGMRGSLIHDQGAYAYQDINIPFNSATSLPGTYILPALAMDIHVAQTNRVPVSSVRGAGYPQPVFVTERLLDRVARELGLDPAEVRRRNLIPAAKMPYEKPFKERSGAPVTYDTGDYPASQAQALEAADWAGFAARQVAARAQGRLIGIGIANAVKGTGRGPFESGVVRVATNGRVSVFTGAAAMGQGLGTALAQICARELGVGVDDITVIAGDTGRARMGLGGFASRQLVTAGSSVLMASREVATKARKVASSILEAAEADLELVDGAVRVAGAPQLAVSLGDIARVLRGGPGYGFPEGVEPGLDAEFHYRTDALTYANACHVAEVEVDPGTGDVTVLRYTAMQDCGRLINPLIVDGQVHGAIAHGLGNAIFEHTPYDSEGQPLATTYADYLLPTATEVPHFDLVYRESPTPLNPLGAKGAGEVGTIPATAAVIAAIEDALAHLGVRLTHAPVSPVEIVRRVNAARQASDPVSR
jgi:carbon-monoxide dehydrogenase large subunit